MKKPWWLHKEEDAYGPLMTNLDGIKTAQNARIFNGVRYDSIFDGVDYLGTASTWGMFDRRPRMPPISLNAIRIVGDILLSKLVQAETKVTFLTDGGSWAERKKAEILDKFMFGEFYRMDIYEKATIARQNALKQGNGYLKFSAGEGEDKGKVVCEIPHPLEMWADNNECFSGPPRQLYQERFMSKEIALGLWGDDPEKRMMIERSKVIADNNYHWFSEMAGEMIRLVEGWHLASGGEDEDGNQDGRHIIACEGGTLLYEDWTRKRFPFAVFRLYQRSRGYYAIGLVERQLEQQLTLNKLIRRKHACIHLLSAPYLLVEAGSRVVKAHFNTDIGNEITYLGTKPELVINKVVPPDVDAAIPQLISWMFQDAGINELEATGQKPEGLDSAPAIERYSDTSGIRHVPVLKANERFFMDIAECILDEVRDIAKETGDYETFGHFKNAAQVLKWSQLNLEQECYVMKMAPMNTLPSTPAGKVNEVIRLSNAGVLNPVQAVRALASPDIDSLTSDITAPEEDIEWTIYQMTKDEDAKYLPPEPFQDLQQGLIKVNNALLRERDNEAPPAVLQRLMRWLADADAMLADQQSAMQAEQAGMQAPQPQGAAPQPLGQATQSPLSSAPQTA